MASSCSHRQTVLSLMRATKPERSACRAKSAALSRDSGAAGALRVSLLCLVSDANRQLGFADAAGAHEAEQAHAVAQFLYGGTHRLVAAQEFNDRMRRSPLGCVCSHPRRARSPRAGLPGGPGSRAQRLGVSMRRASFGRWLHIQPALQDRHALAELTLHVFGSSKPAVQGDQVAMPGLVAGYFSQQPVQRLDRRLKPALLDLQRGQPMRDGDEPPLDLSAPGRQPIVIGFIAEQAAAAQRQCMFEWTLFFAAERRGIELPLELDHIDPQGHPNVARM
jgi:hypothetical protein